MKKLFLIISVMVLNLHPAFGDKNETSNLESVMKSVELHKPSVHANQESVPAETAHKWLVNGNKRFTTNGLRKDGQSSADIRRLASGQTPHSIILSCSDSRVPPELVFDQKLGELFTVRTAGQALDANAIGSIEYAIEHLGAKLIVVMGHTSCGAVKAALSTINGGDLGSPSLNALAKDIHPRLKEFSKRQPTSEVKTESWSNAHGVSEDLIARSEIIKKKVQSGEVKIETAPYHLGSGQVEFESK